MLMRVLGVDPGLRVTGYGCVEPSAPADVRLVEAGVLRLQTGATRRPPRLGTDGADPAARPGVLSISDRLVELERDIAGLIERLRPTLVAVESLFAHYAHPATAIAMGHARGVILLCIRRAGLGLVELKPTEVKRFMTGNGHASKAQMQAAVGARLGLAAPPEPPDVADALAVALCAGWRAAPDTPAGASLRRLSARAR